MDKNNESPGFPEINENNPKNGQGMNPTLYYVWRSFNFLDIENRWTALCIFALSFVLYSGLAIYSGTIPQKTTADTVDVLSGTLVYSINAVCSLLVYIYGVFSLRDLRLKELQPGTTIKISMAGAVRYVCVYMTIYFVLALLLLSPLALPVMAGSVFLLVMYMVFPCFIMETNKNAIECFIYAQNASDGKKPTIFLAILTEFFAIQLPIGTILLLTFSSSIWWVNVVCTGIVIPFLSFVYMRFTTLIYVDLVKYPGGE